MKKLLITMFIAVVAIPASAQNINPTDSKPEEVNVTYSRISYEGKASIKVVPSEVQTEAKFAKLNGLDFKDGVIEVEVVGNRAAAAGAQARGFVGVAFSIN